MSRRFISLEHAWVAIDDKEVSTQELARVTRWRRSILDMRHSYCGGSQSLGFYPSLAGMSPFSPNRRNLVDSHPAPILNRTIYFHARKPRERRRPRLPLDDGFHSGVCTPIHVYKP